MERGDGFNCPRSTPAIRRVPHFQGLITPVPVSCYCNYTRSRRPRSVPNRGCFCYKNKVMLRIPGFRIQSPCHRIHTDLLAHNLTCRQAGLVPATNVTLREIIIYDYLPFFLSLPKSLSANTRLTKNSSRRKYHPFS